jgi:hypothetical protein
MCRSNWYWNLLVVKLINETEQKRYKKFRNFRSIPWHLCWQSSKSTINDVQQPIIKFVIGELNTICQYGIKSFVQYRGIHAECQFSTPSMYDDQHKIQCHYDECQYTRCRGATQSARLYCCLSLFFRFCVLLSISNFYFWLKSLIKISFRESLLTGKDQYNWPPCTNYFRGEFLS